MTKNVMPAVEFASVETSSSRGYKRVYARLAGISLNKPLVI